MLEEELIELEALAKAASEWPWATFSCDGLMVVTEGGSVVAERVRTIEDAAYIAAMHPQRALKLIAEVRNVRAEAVEGAKRKRVAEGRACLDHGVRQQFSGTAPASALTDEERTALYRLTKMVAQLSCDVYPLDPERRRGSEEIAAVFRPDLVGAYGARRSR